MSTKAGKESTKKNIFMLTRIPWQPIIKVDHRERGNDDDKEDDEY